MTVEEGLQVIVAMILHIRRIKDCSHIWQILLFLSPCLIVDHTDPFLTGLGICNLV